MPNQYWFLFAIFGAAIGAVVQIIDRYLNEGSVFSHPLEPAIISGVLQSMLWVAIPFVGFEYPESQMVALLAIFGGMLHIASLFFYFQVVFSFRDVSATSMLWNLLVAMVPMLAFLLLGERLDILEYFGIFLLFSGAIALSSLERTGEGIPLSVAGKMLIAVFLMGLSMVCLKGVYAHSSYWGGYLLYNFGIVGGGVIGYIFFLPERFRRKFHRTFRASFFFFLGIEFLQLLGEFFSNLATSLGSVSLVAAIESLQPLFVILIVSGMLLVIKVLHWKRLETLRSMCFAQLGGLRGKTFAAIFMVLGAYLVEHS